MKIISTLLPFVLILSSACSGDDLEDIGVDRSKSLSELTAEESQALCESQVFSGDEFSDQFEELSCYMLGGLVSSLGESESFSCDEFVTQCVAEGSQSEDIEETDCSEPIEVPELCTATVGEIEACFDTIQETVDSLHDGVTCDNAIERMFGAQDLFASPECLVVEDHCAGFLPDLDDETLADE